LLKSIKKAYLFLNIAQRTCADFFPVTFFKISSDPAIVKIGIKITNDVKTH